MNARDGKRSKQARLTLALVCAVMSLPGCSGAAHYFGVDGLGHQPDGTYLPTPVERAYNCAELRRASEFEVSRIRGADGRAQTELQEAPKTLGSLFGRLGSDKKAGSVAARDFYRGVEKLTAFRLIAHQKNCDAYDYQEELKNTREGLNRLGL